MSDMLLEVQQGSEYEIEVIQSSSIEVEISNLQNIEIEIESIGAKGDKGDNGGLPYSGFGKISVQVLPPDNPSPNDLWVDISGG